MNDRDYELLSQFLDGELDEISVRRLHARLEAEPALRETYAELRSLDRRLGAAFAGTDEVPERVRAMVRPTTANVVPLSRPSARPAWHYAVAASLVAAAGLLLAPQWQNLSEPSPSLASVLETSPSMAAGWEVLAEGRKVRPVLSFHHVDGNWCREYLMVEGLDSTRGVACRVEGDWQVQVTVAAELPGSSAQFRPAGADDADEVAEYLARYSASIALSASDEQQLINQSWQP